MHGCPMWAMVVKEFRELVRDRRTMAMLIALPLILLIVFGYAANFTVDTIDVQVYGPQADQVAAQVSKPFHVTELRPDGTRNDAVDALRNNDTDVAFVTSASARPEALVDGSSLFVAQSAVGALGHATGITVNVLFNPDLRTSW